MVSNQPKITVVIAVYNAGETLSECLKSVLEQTYPHIELVVIDGGSTDKSIDVLCSYSEDIDYWVSESDRGIYDAWNKGVLCSSGEWICFLGADDFFRGKDVIDKISKRLQGADSDILFAYSKLALLDHYENEMRIVGENWDKAFKTIHYEMSVPQPAMMHKREIFSRGLFDENFKIAGDYELFLRECTSTNVLFIQDVIAVSMRLTGVSNQLKYALVSLKEERLAQRRYISALPSWQWVLKSSRIRLRLALNLIFGENAASTLVRFIRSNFYNQ